MNSNMPFPWLRLSVVIEATFAIAACATSTPGSGSTSTGGAAGAGGGGGTAGGTGGLPRVECPYQLPSGETDPYAYGDCDAKAFNGCETGLMVDANNCGACGNVCSVDLPHEVPRCHDGKCLPGTCAPGWTDCDQDPKNGCEVDHQNDAANCFLCGFACYGGSPCVGGWCITQGFTVATETSLNIGTLLVDDASVFYVTTDKGPGADHIKAAAKTGGTPIDLFEGRLDGSPYSSCLGSDESAVPLFADSSSVYFTRLDSSGARHVSRVPKSGGAVEDLTDGALVGLANDMAYVAKVTTDAFSTHLALDRLDLTTMQLTPLVTDAASDVPLAFVVGATSLYWSSNGHGLLRAPLGGGAATVMEAPQGGECILGLFADADAVYAGSGNGFRRIPIDGGTNSTLSDYPALALSNAGGELFWAAAAMGGFHPFKMVLSMKQGAKVVIRESNLPGQPASAGADSEYVYISVNTFAPLTGKILKVSR